VRSFSGITVVSRDFGSLDGKHASDRGVRYFRKRSVRLGNINPFALLLAEALPTKHLDVAMGEIPNDLLTFPIVAFPVYPRPRVHRQCRISYPHTRRTQITTFGNFEFGP
jgi:hypothetical protein